VVFPPGTLRMKRVMGVKTGAVRIGDPHLLALVLPRLAANDNTRSKGISQDERDGKS